MTRFWWKRVYLNYLYIFDLNQFISFCVWNNCCVFFVLLLQLGRHLCVSLCVLRSSMWHDWIFFKPWWFPRYEQAFFDGFQSFSHYDWTSFLLFVNTFVSYASKNQSSLKWKWSDNFINFSTYWGKSKHHVNYDRLSCFNADESFQQSNGDSSLVPRVAIQSIQRYFAALRCPALKIF